MKTEQSIQLFKEAQKYIPGGVNSPVRAFKSVGGDPVFIKSAKGAFLYDEDGNRYIDMINSWGPMILGHANEETTEAIREAVEYSFSFGTPTKKEIAVAELIMQMVPSVEKVRMVNSGTEAAMSAIRLARGFTGKDKIIKFEGNYHGHGDSFLIAAGSGVATLGTPDSPGVTRGTAKDTLTAPYNDLAAVKELVDANEGEVAAIILEPVAGNMGLVVGKREFLQGLRDLCTEKEIILIFDEVMTGFRLDRGGAQDLFNIYPDMTCLGKVIGGGLPVGAYGGKAEIMDYVAPQGPVYQAGTLSGNPIAMAAGYATLKTIDEHADLFKTLESNGKMLKEKIDASIKKYELPIHSAQLGSMFTLFFKNGSVNNFVDAKESHLEAFGLYFREMLKQGVYLAPSQFESLFFSIALTHDLIDEIGYAADNALRKVKETYYS